jgi:acyl-[acyl-carrier-protein] desaturase
MIGSRNTGSAGGLWRPPADLPPLPQLGLTEVRGAVEAVVQRGADQAWSLGDVAWDTLRPELLTDDDRSVVSFITLIEDHLPGYLSWLLDTFPVDGSDADVATVAVRREYVRFFVAWAYDEERHASVLTRYQEQSGMAEPERLRLDLAEVARHHFQPPYLEPIEVFVYTMLQEKATQLFYQQFRAVVAEPVLSDVLRRMSRDEARHFSLYAHLVEQYLQRDFEVAAPHLKEVLRTFRMPLADVLPGYRRWSDKVARTARYDHTEAYSALHRLVDRYANAAGDGRHDLEHLLAAIRSMP